MRKLQDTKPIWHALIWIGLYIVAVNIGDALGEQLRFAHTTGIVLATMANRICCDLAMVVVRSWRTAFLLVRKC